MLGGDVADEFHYYDGFPDARAAEEADFSAFGVRRDEVDDFYAGFKYFGRGFLFGKSWRAPVYRGECVAAKRAFVVDYGAGYAEHASEYGFADGDTYRVAGVAYVHAARESFGRGHRNAPDAVVADVLEYFECYGVSVFVYFQRVQYSRNFSFLKTDVDDGADYLCYSSCAFQRGLLYSI
jgi:hypothetical protein